MSTASAVGLRSERGPILLALMLSTALIAIDSTILATAVPSIVGDLGGFAQGPWLFSVYLLAQAVSVPVYSKLADTVGRRPVVLVGIGVFLLGSVLCGFAWSMTSLIVMRAIQGLGAGAILPLTITIAGDIYTVAERARVQGYIASVWAVSAVVGPTLGGAFAQFASWRWIFFVNVPVCLVAAWVLGRSYRESIARRHHRIDYAGAAVLTTSLALLILAALEGGQAWAWTSWQSIGSFVVGSLLLGSFLAIERRAAEPVLPLGLLTRRLIVTTVLISAVVGAIIVGSASFVPTFLEHTTGATPVVAGLALATLTVGWPISASQSGRLYLRIGFRATALIGLAITSLGSLGLWLTSASPSVWSTAAACFVVGFGLGLAATPTLIAAQASVPWHERAVVTGSVMFMRSVGSAVGVAVFGAIANGIIAAEGGPGSAHAIQTGSTAVFLAVLVAASIGLAVASFMPQARVEDVEHGSGDPVTDAA